MHGLAGKPYAHALASDGYARMFHVKHPLQSTSLEARYPGSISY
jgi:hypothetical protein